MSIRIRRLLSLLPLAAAAFVLPAAAAGFPSRPINLIVPYPPGGTMRVCSAAAESAAPTGLDVRTTAGATAAWVAGVAA